MASVSFGPPTNVTEQHEPINLLDRAKRLLEEAWAARTTWEEPWREIACNIRPERPNLYETWIDQGDHDRSEIFDLTVVHASGLSSNTLSHGTASPDRPWIDIELEDEEGAANPSLEEERWLAEFKDQILRVFHRSNFYPSHEEVIHDALDFGTACLHAYEDHENVAHFHSYPIGSYAFGCDPKGRVNALYRKTWLTTSQMAGKFGLEQCSKQVQDEWKNGKRHVKHEVHHAIIPNDAGDNDSFWPEDWAYLDLYWEAKVSVTEEEPKRFLRRSGYKQFPIFALRWSRNIEDTYGVSCPGWVALPFVKMLNRMEQLGLNALEKDVYPPLKAPLSMQNRPVSLMSGEITWEDALQQGAEGVRPLHEVDVPYQHLYAKQDMLRAAIYQIYMVNELLAALGDQRTQPATAEEWKMKQREQLRSLGAVYQRAASDYFTPLVEWIAARLIAIAEVQWAQGADGIIPQPPESMRGRKWKVTYISEVATVLKMVGLSGIERHVEFAIALAGNTGQVEVMDNLNLDEVMALHARVNAVPPKVRRSEDEMAEQRAQRAQEAAMRQAVEAAPGIAKAAKDASEADAGGESVLNRMMNSGPGVATESAPA